MTSPERLADERERLAKGLEELATEAFVMVSDCIVLHRAAELLRAAPPPADVDHKAVFAAIEAKAKERPSMTIGEAVEGLDLSELFEPPPPQQTEPDARNLADALDRHFADAYSAVMALSGFLRSHRSLPPALEPGQRIEGEIVRNQGWTARTYYEVTVRAQGQIPEAATHIGARASVIIHGATGEGNEDG